MEPDCGAGFEYKAAPPPGTVPESVYTNGGCTPHDDGGYCCKTCAICMLALARGETVGLACGDTFHKSCHDRLRQNPQFSGKCPSCRQTEAQAMAKWGFEDVEIETSDVPAPQQQQQQQQQQQNGGVPAAMHNIHHQPVGLVDPPESAPGYPNSRLFSGPVVFPITMPAIFAIPLVGDHDPFARFALPFYNKRPNHFFRGQPFYDEDGESTLMTLQPYYGAGAFGGPPQMTFLIARHRRGRVLYMYIAHINAAGQAYVYEDSRAVQHE
jgi:hypothetical protein